MYNILLMIRCVMYSIWLMIWCCIDIEVFCLFFIFFRVFWRFCSCFFIWLCCFWFFLDFFFNDFNLLLWFMIFFWIVFLKWDKIFVLKMCIFDEDLSVKMFCKVFWVFVLLVKVGFWSNFLIVLKVFFFFVLDSFNFGIWVYFVFWVLWIFLISGCWIVKWLY